MIRIPKRHYKLFAIRFLFLTITLDYWNKEFTKYRSNGKIFHFFDHSHYDLSGDGFLKKRILLFIAIFKIRIDFCLPWYNKKHDFNL